MVQRSNPRPQGWQSQRSAKVGNDTVKLWSKPRFGPIVAEPGSNLKAFELGEDQSNGETLSESQTLMRMVNYVKDDVCLMKGTGIRNFKYVKNNHTGEMMVSWCLLLSR